MIRLTETIRSSAHIPRRRATADTKRRRLCGQCDVWHAGVCAHTRSFAGHANISTAKKPIDQQLSLYREHSISHKHLRRRNRCCATLLGSSQYQLLSSRHSIATGTIPGRVWTALVPNDDVRSFQQSVRIYHDQNGHEPRGRGLRIRAPCGAAEPPSTSGEPRRPEAKPGDSLARSKQFSGTAMKMPCRDCNASGRYGHYLAQG